MKPDDPKCKFTYLLDLREATKPPFWREGDPVYLPLVDGEHESDFDLVMDNLSPDFIERAYGCLAVRIGTDQGLDAKAHCWPIGVNKEKILEMGGRVICLSWAKNKILPRRAKRYR